MPSNPDHHSKTLRLVWPQWQGAGTASVEELAGEFDLDVARRGYVVGTTVLDAVLPQRQDARAEVPVAMDDALAEEDGIESKAVVVRQLGEALAVLERESPDRILTLGGECSVSVAPFSYLAAKHGEDLAVVWIDSHPDSDTNETAYNGYHAMAVSAVAGHGDADVLSELPGTVDGSRIALAGLHNGEEDALANVEKWGLATFSPDDLRTSSAGLLAWLKQTGCTKVAIHFDVDTIDSDEVVLGLGIEPGGLTTAQVRRVISDLDGAADLVALTVAEFFPRQVMRLQQLLSGLPLVG